MHRRRRPAGVHTALLHQHVVHAHTMRRNQGGGRCVASHMRVASRAPLQATSVSPPTKNDCSGRLL